MTTEMQQQNAEKQTNNVNWLQVAQHQTKLKSQTAHKLKLIQNVFNKQNILVYKQWAVSINQKI